MCGSNNVIKDDGLFVCQSCGTKYSVEEARKIMFGETVEVEGTVKIDHSTELNNLYAVARRAKDSNNDENAYEYYNQILVKDPNSWEAQFYVVYFKSRKCTIKNIAIAASDMKNTINPVLNLIKNNVSNQTEQRKAVEEVVNKTCIISALLFNAAKNHYDNINPRIKNKFLQDYVNKGFIIKDTLYLLGDEVKSIFGESYSDLFVDAWKIGINIHTTLFGNFKDKDIHANKILMYYDKVSKYDPSYERPKLKKGLFGHY